MSEASSFDFSHGDLPPWINNLVAVARPAFTAGIVAIPCLGAATVGTVALFFPGAAMDSVKASIAFLQGIPDAAYGMITAIALGFTAAKSYEAVKNPPPPAGSPSPEAGPNATAPETATAEPAPVEIPRPQFAPAPPPVPAARATEIME